MKCLKSFETQDMGCALKNSDSKAWCSLYIPIVSHICTRAWRSSALRFFRQMRAGTVNYTNAVPSSRARSARYLPPVALTEFVPIVPIAHLRPIGGRTCLATDGPIRGPAHGYMLSKLVEVHYRLYRSVRCCECSRFQCIYLALY